MPFIEGEKMLTCFSRRRAVPIVCLLPAAAAETVKWARIVKNAGIRENKDQVERQS
jgi:hypothetical protein